jgi:WD40 repeat protein
MFALTSATWAGPSRPSERARGAPWRGWPWIGAALVVATLAWAASTLRPGSETAAAEMRRLGVVGGFPAMVFDVAFSTRGDLLAVAGAGGVALRDARIGRLVHWLPVGEPRSDERVGAWPVAFSHNGRRLAAGAGDGTVTLWEVETGRAVRVVRRSVAEVQSVALSADGAMIASASRDGTVTLWQAGSTRPLRSLVGHYDEEVRGLAFSPDGRTLATGSPTGGVRLWSAATGELVRTLDDRWPIARVLFSPDGRTLASAGGRQVRLWDLAGDGAPRVLEHGGEVRQVAFSADGARVALLGMDGKVGLWDAAAGRPTRTLRLSGTPAAVAFGAGGTLRVASVAGDESVLLWEAR